MAAAVVCAAVIGFGLLIAVRHPPIVRRAPATAADPALATPQLQSARPSVELGGQPAGVPLRATGASQPRAAR
jgi:hypothetical protein